MEASEQIEKFQEFISLNYEKDLHRIVSQGEKSLVIDFALLSMFDPDLAEALLEEPEEVFKAAEIAVEQFDLKTSLRIRFKALPQSQNIPIRDIRSSHIDKLISFEGIVRQASEVRPQVVSARFECPSCGNTINILQIDSQFKEPSRCSCGRKGKFRLLNKSLVDAQRLVVEEAAEDLEGGAQPKRLSIFLREDLVEPKMENKTTPGTKVRIIGIIKEIPIPLRTGGMSTRYDLIMQSNYIEPVAEDPSVMDLNDEEVEEIEILAKNPKIYEMLIESIAPSILGHEKIKEAIILQLMGGVKKIKDDGTVSRGDIHILLVGDPGAGKSAISTFVAKTAPKSRYVAGMGASGKGMTASVVRDEFLRGWALEAGAMVLANKGVLVIDEMDKMSTEDTSALHEGLEQQQITIARANIQATLRCETTVLAAANPKYGRFDPYTPIAEQINMPPALINRFDLIFPIQDLPDKKQDSLIAGHILESQKDPSSVKTRIPVSLLRKYIAYAKQRVFPKLTKGSIEEIKSFYVNLRNAESSGDNEFRSIPISARQLEALVRLAEGSARVRLSDKVERSDARRATFLLKFCLEKVGIDPETGKIDIDIVTTGIPTSTRNKIFLVRQIINDFDPEGKKAIPVEDIISRVEEKGIDERVATDLIDKLKSEGEVFEPKHGFIQKIA